MRAKSLYRLLAIIAVAMAGGSLFQPLAHAGFAIQGDRSDRVAVQADDAPLADVISALGRRFGFAIVGSIVTNSKLTGRWTGTLPVVLERLLKNDGHVIVRAASEHDVARVIIIAAAGRAGSVEAKASVPSAPIEPPKAAGGLGGGPLSADVTPATNNSSPLMTGQPLYPGLGGSPVASSIADATTATSSSSPLLINQPLDPMLGAGPAASRIAQASAVMNNSFDVGGSVNTLPHGRVGEADATTVAALNAIAMQRLEQLVSGLKTTCVGRCR